MPRGLAIARTSVEVIPDHSYQDIMAVRAVATGTASESQQKVAFQWIVKRAAMIGGMTYNPDKPNEIFINEGRRFVGVVLMEMVSEPQASIDKRLPGNPASREPKPRSEE